MGNFVIGADMGQVHDPTALALVEFFDTPTTRGAARRHGMREVQEVRALPLGLSYQSVIEHLSRVAAPLGPDTRLVFDATGSRGVKDIFYDAYRAGMFVRRPLPVTIVGGDAPLSRDTDGNYSIGQVELVRNLREMVATRGFTFAPGATGTDDVIGEAMAFEPETTATGRLRFGSRKHDDRVFALALAVYPWFAPPHLGRRFVAGGQVWESPAAAKAALGSGAMRPEPAAFRTVTRD